MLRPCLRQAVLAILCAALQPLHPPCFAQQTPSQAAGLTLQALSTEDLDAIEQKVGHRVGVLVTAVAPGSPAAAAGLRANDLLFLVGQSAVASPEAVEQALAGKTGEVKIGGLRAGADGSGELIETKLNLPAPGAAPAPAAPTTGQTPADVQDKLKALDAALAAGIITQDEYNRKQAELMAQAKPAGPDPQTQEKLKALDAARAAGIITEAEYQQKRAALLAAAGGAPAAGGAAAAPPKPSGDPLTAYFDMLDFMRTQAFGRPVSTPAADRQRLAALLQQADAKTQQNVTQGLQPVPQLWAELQQKWQAADEAKRGEQREHWGKQLLLPTFLYPPPLETESFKGRNDRVVFEHPKGWVVTQTEAEGNQYLYLGPEGTQTTWEQVLDPAKSPPGALFAVMPLPAELKGVKYLEGARMAAREYVTTGGANMTEINAVDLGEGAIITLRGRFPGQNEDRFFWVGVVKYGPDYILAGRLGGPVAQAETLVPAFSHMVMTMELNPPEGGDGGYGGAMVDYYTSRVGNIVAASSWH